MTLVSEPSTASYGSSALASGTPASTTVHDLDRDLVERFLRFEADADELPTPAWGPIGETVYQRTYSRDLPDHDRREVWAETVRRVVLGSLGFVDERHWLPGEAAELFGLIYTFHASPAGRHLWVTGTGASNTRNCFFSGYEEMPSVHSSWLGMQLFLGGGVGSSYATDLIQVTKPILGNLEVRITCHEDHADYAEVVLAAGDLFDIAVDVEGETVVRVADSREGWCETWATIMDSPTVEGTHRFLFDVSDVRPFGAPLASGGQASGPGPLTQAIRKVTAVVQGATGRRLRGLEYADIDHAIAESVVAGGTRRSARMSLMHWADTDIFEFISMKADGMSHFTTNISVETDNEFNRALNDPAHPQYAHANQVLTAVAEGMAINGEPGFVDTEAHSIGEPARIRGVNPCAEIGLNPFESCNIGSVNVGAFGTDFHGALRAFELMARFLYRATEKPHDDERSAAIEAVNRRIGLGVLGFQPWLAAHGVKLSQFAINTEMRRQMTEFRKAARRAADALADSLGTPRSIKVTAVAPTGSISQLSGTTAGIAAVYAARFIRRVRYSVTDPQIPTLESQGYVIFDDPYAANTKVVEFPVQDGILDRFDEGLIEDSFDLDFEQFMSMVKAVQDTLLGGTDGNAVSATAQIPANTDPLELEAALRRHIGSGLKGITVFPDLSNIPAAPLSRLTKDEYLSRLAEIDETAAFYAELTDSNVDGSCASGACPVK